MINKGQRQKEGTKNKTMVGIAIVIGLLLTMAISGCVDGPRLKISNIKAENLEPVELKYFGPVNVYEIKRGESVKLILTVENEGKETVYRNDYYVGIKVVSPDNGNKYWALPSEKLLGSDLSTKGTVNQTFVIENKKEEPVSGQFKIQAYIKSVESGEEIAHSDNVKIIITSS